MVLLQFMTLLGELVETIRAEEKSQASDNSIMCMIPVTGERPRTPEANGRKRTIVRMAFMRDM